jgi:hypothetical protein
METLQHVYTPEFSVEKKRSLAGRFLTWCESREEERLLWLGFIVGGHGCVFTPLTLLFIILAGNLTIFWPFAIAAMTMSLVVNLAALPTKITIPVFFLSLLIDLFIIVNCIAIGLTAPPVL